MKKLLKTVSLITLLIFLHVSFALAADQVSFYTTDPAGTPLVMTEVTGSVVWRADYLPFGEENIGQSTVQNNKMFVGKEKDSESGLYYFGARYMDAGAGRFSSSDPVGAVDPETGRINEKRLHEPQRLNLYAYGLNNPYRFVDPDGADPGGILNCHVCTHNDPNENLIGAFILAPLAAAAAPGLMAAAGDAALMAAIRYPVATAVATEITAGMVGAPSNSAFFTNNSTRYFAAQKQVGEI